MKIALLTKWFFIGAGIFLVLYLLAIAWTLNAYRFKVIDPKDPNFEAENFRFEDYFLDDEIDENIARDVVFPVGSSREYVENILITKIGCASHDRTTAMAYSDPVPNAATLIKYTCIPWWNTAYKIFGLLNGVMFDGANFGIIVYYDKDNKVIKRY